MGQHKRLACSAHLRQVSLVTGFMQLKRIRSRFSHTMSFSSALCPPNTIQPRGNVMLASTRSPSQITVIPLRTAPKG